MTMHDQDPDILRWGLHLLLGDDTSNSEETIRDDAGNYDAECSRKSNSEATTGVDAGNYDTENDAVIAHALQEEFSQLAIAEASGSSHEGEEHLQASVLAQDWSYPSTRNFDSGNAGSHEEIDAEPSSSSGHMLNDGDELPLEFTDFSVLDGEVGKRLNQMVPVPHVPRTNREIPSVDEAMSDHERLLERLRLYELVELKVQGDGNCQFRALSDQFYRTPEHHKFVREQVVNQLKAFPEIYEGYVPMDYEEYIRKMSKCGEWGDHVTLQAAADSYGVKIFVLTSFKDTCYIEILPNVQKSERVIFLSFWAEVHYNSIYPEGEMPAVDAKKKKRQGYDVNPRNNCLLAHQANSNMSATMCLSDENATISDMWEPFPPINQGNNFDGDDFSIYLRNNYL